MVTIELMGGLGNQLFQICSLIGYSLEHNIPFYFQNKQITCGWRKKQYWDTMFSSLNKFIAVHKVTYVYREPHFHYASIPKLPPESALLGYFQSYKYFDAHRDTLFKLLDIDTLRSTIHTKTAYSYSNTISIHFRLGDYKNLQHQHPILNLDYYQNALQQCLKETHKVDWKVLVFFEEEDLPSIKQRITNLKQSFPSCEFILVDTTYEDWEQILIMSLCAHNIIANSSFSWFGAYFNTNKNKKVYYPTVWFGTRDKCIDDMCPCEWLPITS